MYIFLWYIKLCNLPPTTRPFPPWSAVIANHYTKTSKQKLHTNYLCFSITVRVLDKKTISVDLLNINRIHLLKVLVFASVNLTVFQYFYLWHPNNNIKANPSKLRFEGFWLYVLLRRAYRSPPTEFTYCLYHI